VEVAIMFAYVLVEVLLLKEMEKGDNQIQL
jgi:hypothetical protein